jgi:DNA anti-recombination protein RmuC
MQYHFKESNVQVDCVVKTADGLIPIDAKFPLINYQKMFDEELTDDERKSAKKLFKD